MKTAVIGGGGKMGQWLCRRIIEEGREVIVSDRNDTQLREVRRLYGVKVTDDNKKAVRRTDIVIVSVPIDNFEQVIKEIAPLIRPEQIVMDITSVKAGPVAVMHRYIKKGTILGAHPLFGPDVTFVKGQNFVLTPTSDKEKALAVKARRYLKTRGARVKFMGPEAHDKLMAVVQGLSHFVAIISADALSGLGQLKEMKAVSTTTFRVFLDYLDTVIREDPALYAAIQMEHHGMPEIYQKLMESLERWSGLVNRKNKRGFIKRMSTLKIFLEKND